MKEKVTEIFCIVDDFCNGVDENFADKLLPRSKKLTNPSYGLANKERSRNRGLFGFHGVGNEGRKNMDQKIYW